MNINPLLIGKKEESLYLFNLSLDDKTLAKFRGIRYVIMQGSGHRAAVLAKKLAARILNVNTNFFEPINLVYTSNFAVYRVGNILSVSHGMGNVAIDALLHAVTKLLYYAGSTNLEYIRVGTSGGIGVDEGAVIVTKRAFMANLAPYYSTYELDQRIDIPTEFDDDLVVRILVSQPENLHFNLLSGNSIAADDFYLGQCRYDGAMKGRQDRVFRAEFFKKVHALGIYNFEMESTALAAFCYQAQIPATMIAVTIVNRFNGDPITATPQQLAEYSDRSQAVAINYLLSRPDIV